MDRHSQNEPARSDWTGLRVTSNIAMWSALALAAWAFLPPVLGNYPAITPEEVWCTVPNYRHLEASYSPLWKQDIKSPNHLVIIRNKSL